MVKRASQPAVIFGVALTLVVALLPGCRPLDAPVSSQQEPAEDERAGPRDFASLAAARRGQIYTIAGDEPLPSLIPPSEAALLGLSGIAVDPQDGTMYVADSVRHSIFRIDPRGTQLEHFAGTGIGGFNGDGHSAVETRLHVPSGLAVDPRNGDVYVADTHNYRVRVFSKDGSRAWTAAGMGVEGMDPRYLPTVFPAGAGLQYGNFSGDGGPAAEAELNLPTAVAVDRQGVLYVADAGNNRIRAVNLTDAPRAVAGVELAPGAIDTVVGAGRGVEALGYPRNVAVTREGDLLVVDTYQKRLLWVGRETGKADVLLGLGDMDVADRAALMPSVEGLAVTPDGDVFYSLLDDCHVYRLDVQAARRETLRPGSQGEIVQLEHPSSPGRMAAGPDGSLYVLNAMHHTVHRIQGRNEREVVGSRGRPTGKVDPQSPFSLLAPMAMDDLGNLYLGDVFLHQVRRVVPPDAHVEVVAGTGVPGRSGDGGPAREARLNFPSALVVHGDEMWVADPGTHVIRKLEAPFGDGPIHTIAGCGKFGESGDGGPASEACLGVPGAMARHPLTGDLYIVDTWFGTIRRIDGDGVIHHVAGSGEAGFSGDGGPATEAQLNWPGGIAFDSKGNLFVSDLFNHRIRRIDPEGIITTYAGTGKPADGGDDGPAVEANLFYPAGLVVDIHDNLYVADSNNHRVRRISPEAPHVITSLAGTGRRGLSGDGGPAHTSRLNVPRGLALDREDGFLYIADSLNNRIRAVRLDQ